MTPNGLSFFIEDDCKSNKLVNKILRSTIEPTIIQLVMNDERSSQMLGGKRRVQYLEKNSLGEPSTRKIRKLTITKNPALEKQETPR